MIKEIRANYRAEQQRLTRNYHLLQSICFCLTGSLVLTIYYIFI